MEGNGIYKAMAAVMAEMGAIGKNKRTDMGGKYGFNYRGIDDVYNALNPLLGKHGIFVLPELVEHKSEERRTDKGGRTEIVYCRMRYTFAHEDGSRCSCEVLGEAQDTSDKATNKAMAIAHKYALLQTFCIPTEDMQDPDAEVVNIAAREVRQAEQVHIPTAYLEGEEPMRIPTGYLEGEEAQPKSGGRFPPDVVNMFKHFLAVKFKGSSDKMMKDMGSYFERKVTSTADVTEQEMRNYLSDLEKEYKGMKGVEA